MSPAAAYKDQCDNVFETSDTQSRYKFETLVRVAHLRGHQHHLERLAKVFTDTNAECISSFYRRTRLIRIDSD
jgi:hypothetical protein